MLKRLIFLQVFIILFFVSDIFADTIYMKNGSKVSGIITEENENSVKIKINIGGVVTFSKEDIERIERDTKDKHSDMEESWRSEKTKRDEAGSATFKQEQIEKGLVEYEGEWVTPEEKERLQAASIAKGAGDAYKEQKISYSRDSTKRSSFANKLLEKGDWFARETEHFAIYYKDPLQAKIISDKAEYYFEKIAYDLGYEDKLSWDSKCRVYIIRDIDAWKRFLKGLGFNPELVGGFVPHYEEREMFLCALSDMYLALTFPHELTHLIFREIAGENTIPLWLNEGLANYEASVTSISNELLVERIRQGAHILLGDLLRITDYPEGKEIRELFYAQSEKLVEFLITQYGRKKFNKFYKMVLRDKSFKDSLLSAYNGDFKDIADFNIKLVEYIVK